MADSTAECRLCGEGFVRPPGHGVLRSIAMAARRCRPMANGADLALVGFPGNESGARGVGGSLPRRLRFPRHSAPTVAPCVPREPAGAAAICRRLLARASAMSAARLSGLRRQRSGG